MALSNWPDGRRVAVVFNVAFESWSIDHYPAIGPMGNPLPSQIPDLQAESWGRYGRTEGIGRLLRILSDHGTRASVMVSGVIAHQAPELIEAVAAGGHDIVAHGFSQDVLPGAQTVEDQRLEIARCIEALTVGGVRPRGWMSPRGTPSRATGDLLAEHGFDWHGDCFDSDTPYIETHPGGKLVAIPFNMEINDLPVGLKAGHGARELLERFTMALDWAVSRESGPLHLDVTVHAHFFGRVANAWVWDALISAATARPEVWVATRSDIADAVLAGEG